MNLLENQWTMNDIDDMDIFAYWRVMAYKSNKEYQEQFVPIDALGI
jgi:hypothetical protein